MSNSTNTNNTEWDEDTSAGSETLVDTSLLNATCSDETLDIAHRKSETIQRGIAKESSNNDAVLSAYRNLSSRRVDLIGDYAGNELFLIDGDSLLLHCFIDQCLDLQNGLQLLHAVYAVENFLSHLKRRKCVFKIVFFDANRDLCIPPGVLDGVDARYLLAREAIIRHLQAHLPKTKSNLSIFLFENHLDPQFLKFLQEQSPYFLMLHDGAFETPASTTVKDKTRQAEQRGIILSFIQQGFNIALINELTWRDSKVITVVLEGVRSSKSSELHDCPTLDTPDLLGKADIIDVRDKIEVLKSKSPTLSERQILLVLTVGELLRKPNDLPSSTLLNLASTLLLHQVLLAHMPLSSRRIEDCSPEKSTRQFLNYAAAIATKIIAHGWSSLFNDASNVCDIGDFIDGRLFYKVYQGEFYTSDLLKQEFKVLSDALQHCFGTVNIQEPTTSFRNYDKSGGEQPDVCTSSKVLPFSNEVFDAHLSPINLQVENNEAEEPSVASQKIFKEISHWHNANRAMDQKGTIFNKNPYQAERAARRNQLFMAEMRTYAASLTNAVGKSLDPETVVVGSNDPVSTSSIDHDVRPSTQANPRKDKPKGGAKAAKKNANKEALLAKAAAEKMKKNDATNEKFLVAWRNSCKDFDNIANPVLRYRKVHTFSLKSQSSWRAIIGPHCELYMLECLLQVWTELCRNGQQHHNMHIVALMWHHVRCTIQAETLPPTILKQVQTLMAKVGFSKLLNGSAAAHNRKKDNKSELKTTTVDLSVGMEPVTFQLVHCGPFLERSFNANVDARVQFKPDEWQSHVLDYIDADKSVFVVAPTSAGKTFISFYAMQKILRADDDGVLVYVAPTKALVNQIAAEIQARYAKNFKYGGKSVWAIHTRDYRINNPTGCQILVTVPAILQIMLLSPSNARSWSTRVRRIIFGKPSTDSSMI